MLDPDVKVFATDLGVPWDSVLREAGLPAGFLDRGRGELVATDYFALWTAFESEVVGRDLAVDLRAAMSSRTVSPPVLAALSSPDLATAAGRVAAYKPLVGPLRLVVHPSGSVMTIEYRWPEGLRPPTLLAVAELVFWVALTRSATRHHTVPVACTVPHLPDGRFRAETYLGTAVQQGETHRISFAAADAQRAFLTMNDDLWGVLAPDMRRRLRALEASATAAGRVETALQETLPSGDSTIATVAGKLLVSVRTLQRQLADEGTAYSHVLAATRERFARRYLSQTELRPSDLAYLLGYDDTSSFVRAFRSWTGRTPHQARHHPDGP